MTTFEQQILQFGEKQKIQELENVVQETDIGELQAALLKRTGSESMTFWNYLLKGFNDTLESKEKRFACVKALFEQMGRVEMSYKQTYDLITRLCLDLPSFPNSQLVEIVEFSIDGLRSGDPKNIGWKDLLPETVMVLATQTSVNMNGIQMPGSEYRSSVIRNLISMKWPVEVMTPMADMFGDLNLSSDEITIVLKKFSNCMQKMAPSELPALAFQLFSLCATASHVIVPIVGFQEFFHHYYYKKLFADMESNTTDFDSIESYSDKELREAEETILHHLSYCTQFKISEVQMCIALRGLSSSPNIILSPFFLSAVISMTRANREPDSRLSSSVILPFLRNVIKSNEDEKELSKSSAWCRNTLNHCQTDLDQTFSVLIDQNKDGKDVVTPGLVSLAFVLLKTKNAPKLNQLAITFLKRFIKKRFIFGFGVVQNVAEWMIVDQEAMQYSECLTYLSVADTFTVSECDKSIKYVLDFLPWIPGDQAMRMMSFILPVLKISHIIRDSFIEMLTKAMHSGDMQTCRMGVYGFCMVLKQLTNSNSQRSASSAAGSFTQQNISGFSLMSQATLGNRSNPQRHFDMLTLEIIGLLRNCFVQSLQIKQTLYEGLTQAIELNPKLVPHILQFIDSHFRSYFEETKIEVKFDKIIKILDNENEVEITDNLGMLVTFVGHCVNLCDKFELNYDTSVINDLINNIIIKLCEKSIILDAGVTLGAMSHYKNELFLQHLNFLESLMGYALWTSSTSNLNVEKIFKLFQLHKEITDESKVALHPKKGAKKAKATADGDQQPNVKKQFSKAENIWSLATIGRFMKLLHEEKTTFAKPEAAAPLRTDRYLVRYVLQSAACHIEQMRMQPQYKQITHSRRAYEHFTEVTRIVYEQCIKRLQNLWANFDIPTALLAAQCLFQCLTTSNQLFDRKYESFSKEAGFHPTSLRDNRHIVSILQSTIVQSVEDEDDLSNEPEGKKIASILLQCLEIVNEHLTYDEKHTIDGYTWLMEFCKSTDLKVKEMGLVHKVLMDQRDKTHSGPFLNSIALRLQKTYGQIDEEDQNKPEFKLKSINEATADVCSIYLCNRIRKQLEDVEYFITKANSLHYKLRITFDEDQENATQDLKTMERSICTQLLHISSALLHLSNVCLPLGSCMDNQLRVLMQLYVCLTNCTKHFILRNSTIPVSLQGTKFEHVLKVAGKPLGTRIYALITYIEANIFEGGSSTKKPSVNPLQAKAKILRETKFLPKLVMRVENFNKFVILLSKKTKTSLENFLHMGTVRDFRIKTSELKEAIDESLTHSSQIEVDESMLGQHEEEDDNEENVLERIESEASTSIRRNMSEEPEEITPDSETGMLEHESNNESNTQVLKNMAKLNKEAKKKKKRSADELEAEAAPVSKRGRKTEAAPVSKRGRKTEAAPQEAKRTLPIRSRKTK